MRAVIEKNIKKEVLRIDEIKEDRRKIKAEFEDFIINKNHPCVMAQTVFSMDKVEFHTYENFGSKNTAGKILKDLKQYIENYDFESNEFLTFMAVFKGRKEYSEKQFEEMLWKQLDFLHEVDTEAWDTAVSSDPSNKASVSFFKY